MHPAGDSDDIEVDYCQRQNLSIESPLDRASRLLACTRTPGQAAITGDIALLQKGGLGSDSREYNGVRSSSRRRTLVAVLRPAPMATGPATRDKGRPSDVLDGPAGTRPSLAQRPAGAASGLDERKRLIPDRAQRMALRRRHRPCAS
ncbi:hypothetical protein PsYK624_081680 [Phanerochaete sordida]|uniref:Uncharacterized protein n=1 Tax=Phanerochaete sordida TaxID=48140 RepID=A0A9P3GC78_9APHY|nr:hypothetical protein PsYK624_081680 [Phanerochaete sordida]